MECSDSTIKSNLIIVHLLGLKLPHNTRKFFSVPVHHCHVVSFHVPVII